MSEAWQHRTRALAALWHRGRPGRERAYGILGVLFRKGSSLAVSALGAILIAYGAYMIYEPAGFILGGFLCWLLQWSAEKDKEAESGSS